MKQLLIIYLLSLLMACASYEKTHIPNKILPKARAAKIPEGSGDNWRYIGLTSNNCFLDEIDDRSIKLTDIMIYQFKDRKTIKKICTNDINFILTDKANGVNDIKNIKFIIGDWLINCNTKEYLLNSINVYDDSGSIISEASLHKQTKKWLLIGNNTIALKQYSYICITNNKLTNLGY